MVTRRPMLSDFALEEAIAQFPSLAAMANALGLSGYQVIQEWRRQRRVPAEYCPEIEGLTGVVCERLNCRVNWALLRGTRTEPAQQQEAA